MISVNYLNFISNRIGKLNTAIFYNFSNSLLKFPTCIIKVTGFDKYGNLWFAVKKPYQDITGLDKEFPAQLNFYNKMHRFYVTVNGKATLIPDKGIHADQAYIRFRIFYADYYCSKKNIKSRFKIADFLINLFSFENAGYHSWQFP
jgi:hypothetical protein